MVETISKPMTEMEQFKQEFNTHLGNFIDSKIQNISKYTNDPFTIDYVNHAKEIILSSGKRVRPYVAYLMYKALGGKEDEKALELLVSLEVFHSFCLIHDDVMDKSTLRHGIPTLHTYIAEKLEKEGRKGDLSHDANSQAILIGDMLHAWSYETLNTDDFNPRIMTKARSYFSEMAEEVCVGQSIDVDIKTRKNVSKESIDEKTRLKTAGYTFIMPLLIGAALSGQETEEIEIFCKEFGERLGVAFQHQDDLLDQTSSASNLGKTTSLDKKNTYFTLYSSPENGKKIISENFDQARVLIKHLSIDEAGKNNFSDLINFVQNRSF